MICKLGLALGCAGIRTDGPLEGHCKVYFDEAVIQRMKKGSCIFKDLRAPQIGIYEPKAVKGRNPAKQAKMDARVKAATRAAAVKPAPKPAEKPASKPAEKTAKA